MKIVCIGDSLTFGYGVREIECWVSLLRKGLNGEVINKGINGDTTDGMTYRFQRDVISKSPTHVIIMGGSNDLIMGRSKTDIINNIEEMINLSIKDGVMPIIGIQPPMDAEMANKYWSAYTDFKQVNENIRAYRDWATSYIKKTNLTCFDFYKAINESMYKYKKEEIYIDGVHFTPRGHSIMAGIINIKK
ncbi:GDSL-type esterase/lipase family protein [Serpentinicella alkaliphila]|uniref:Lysophospholipase L1-like esterase n=1 Tax=Serpentinicella alkaliphila TaxID=1734049 RepID=A0A4R2TN97_9FIRM|nr:GDSL-type esterase/lipase family protein [Serpentinicella alkaliphila]QUH27062.1 hypothetical protein HZR23_15940 [Serpentinicella alkaliphila]TCQ05188.1 lysophospholipase L1-like esterase [Serpentinicella alkaliphila]